MIYENNYSLCRRIKFLQTFHHQSKTRSIFERTTDYGGKVLYGEIQKTNYWRARVNVRCKLSLWNCITLLSVNQSLRGPIPRIILFLLLIAISNFLFIEAIIKRLLCGAVNLAVRTRLSGASNHTVDIYWHSEIIF